MASAAKWLSAAELVVRLGISRSSLYDYVAKGFLPRPVKIAPRCARWSLEEIEKFEERARADRGSP